MQQNLQENLGIFVFQALEVPSWNIRNFILGVRKFHFPKCKKFFKKFFFLKYKNFFNLRARKFHFPKYKKNLFWRKSKKSLREHFSRKKTKDILRQGLETASDSPIIYYFHFTSCQGNLRGFYGLAIYTSFFACVSVSTSISHINYWDEVNS